MFENITSFFKKLFKSEDKQSDSKTAAKERLHLVLMQDRANVSADFLDLMRQEIIEVIKKYIDVDEKEIDVRLTNKTNEDGSNGAPALYANIPIVRIKNNNKSEENNVEEHSAKVEVKNNNSKNDNNEHKEDEIEEEKIEEHKEDTSKEEKDEIEVQIEEDQKDNKVNSKR